MFILTENMAKREREERYSWIINKDTHFEYITVLSFTSETYFCGVSLESQVYPACHVQNTPNT